MISIQVIVIPMKIVQMTLCVGQELQAEKHEHGDVLGSVAVGYLIWMSVWDQRICQHPSQHQHQHRRRPMRLSKFLVARSNSKCIGSLATTGKRLARHEFFISFFNGQQQNLTCIVLIYGRVNRRKRSVSGAFLTIMTRTIAGLEIFIHSASTMKCTSMNAATGIGRGFVLLIWEMEGKSWSNWMIGRIGAGNATEGGSYWTTAIATTPFNDGLRIMGPLWKVRLNSHNENSHNNVLLPIIIPRSVNWWNSMFVNLREDRKAAALCGACTKGLISYYRSFLKLLFVSRLRTVILTSAVESTTLTNMSNCLTL